MYLTKTAQITDERKQLLHQNGDKSFTKKITGISDDVASQVRTLTEIYDGAITGDNFYLQIQCICSQFLREKLRRDGALTRKVSGLIDALPNVHLRHMHDTLLILNRMAIELERLHPRTFVSLSLAIPEAAPDMIETIGRTLFKHNDITWGKVISFLAISSAIATDCVKVGQPELIQSIVDATSSCIIDEVGCWIEHEGGFGTLSDYIRPIGSEHITFLGFLAVLVGFLLFVHFSWGLVRALSKQILNVL